MNYGELKRHVRALIDELSSRGAILPPNKVADLVLKSRYFINDTIYDLATTTAKLPEVFHIAHNPLFSELARDTSKIQKHLPGMDYSTELQGAKACFFECTGPATVLLEQKIDGEWQLFENIEVPDTKRFVEYRRLIDAGDNVVRLRFSGDYTYDYRNYVLYPYPFPREEDIQQHRPWFEYDLPGNFLKLNRVEVKREARQYVPYTNHIERPDKKLAINRYDGPCEFLVHYWRRPNVLTFTGDESIDDVQIIDLAEDAARIAAYNVAGQILISENEDNGVLLINQYEAKKESLITNDISYNANIISVTGW